MEEIIILNIIFSLSPKERQSAIYLYNNDSFIEKIDDKNRLEYLKAKFTVEDEYTWYFLNDEKMQEFINRESSWYYGKLELRTLSGYLVRYLNYKHSGISIRKFVKGRIYIGKDNQQYICLEGSDISDSKWLQADMLSRHRVDQDKQKNFTVPKGTTLNILDWLQLETELVNTAAKAELQDYAVVNNQIVFG